MDEHDAEHLSRLAAELPDRRRRYEVPEGMVIGSDEYKKWMLEQRTLRNRLYQKKQYLKRRMLTLALQKYEEHNLTTVADAIKEVDEQLAELRQLKPVEVSAVRGRPKKVEEPEEPIEVPFIREMADKHGVTYEEAKTIMTSDGYKGDESFVQLMSSRLEDIFKMSKREGGE